MTDAKSMTSTEKVESLIIVIDKMVGPIVDLVNEMSTVKDKIEMVAISAEEQSLELRQFKVWMRWFIAGLAVLTITNGLVQYVAILHNIDQLQRAEKSIDGLERDLAAFLGANAKLGEVVGASVEAGSELTGAPSASTASLVQRSIEAQEELLMVQVTVAGRSDNVEIEKVKDRLKSVRDKKEMLLGKDEPKSSSDKIVK